MTGLTILHASWLTSLAASGAAAAAALGSYNVDPSSVSVSGISAGGFMTVQLSVAYAGVFQKGFGVFAGGPYDCAREQAYGECMFDQVPSIVLPTANMENWSGNQISPVSDLSSRQMYMEVGNVDAVVGPNVMAQLAAQLSNFDTGSNVKYVTTIGAAHTFPTDFNGSGDNACDLSESPFISNCGYDGAGAALEWMYGSLVARNTGSLSGSVVSFAQTGAYGADGLGDTGYLYVPQACQSGSTTCKLHVALHGCGQAFDMIGSTFIDNTGYNMWADTNSIIILYPQATIDNDYHIIWGGTALDNPNACFDWLGWYGDDADQIGGVQMVAIVNQVKQILGES